jgi:solute carrier family 8 (sodium/calcium exchanger)
LDQPLPSPVPSPPESEKADGGGDDDEDDPPLPLMGRLKEAVVGGPPESKTDWALHFFSIIPKVACAFIPNANLLGGYPCFVLSIGLVGLITFFVQESARAISCAMSIPQSVAAITLVALGTSLPDTLASRAAALADETADASLGNITGSNSVNIFLGLGLPWTIGAIYWTSKGLDGMPVPDIGLGYSVLIFEILAAFCLGGLAFRRWRFGYELGGRGKYTAGLVFGSLWVIFITLSAIYLMHDIALF